MFNGPTFMSEVIRNVNLFWTHAFKAYQYFWGCVVPKDVNELLSETVFYNKKITTINVIINGKRTKELLEKGKYFCVY